MRLYLKKAKEYIDKHISELFLSGVLSFFLLVLEIGWHEKIQKQLILNHAPSSQDELEATMAFILLFIVYILFLMWIDKLLSQFRGSKLLSVLTLALVPPINFLILFGNWEKWYGINLFIVFSTFILTYVIVIIAKNRLFMLWAWIKPGSEFDYKRMNIVIGIGGILIGLLVGKS